MTGGKSAETSDYENSTNDGGSHPNSYYYIVNKFFCLLGKVLLTERKYKILYKELDYFT